MEGPPTLDPSWWRRRLGSDPEAEGEEEEEEEEEQEVAAVPWEPPPPPRPPGVVPKALLSPGSVQASGSLSPSLSRWRSDAEDILHHLGFSGPSPGVASRVPSRFFSSPSRAGGIDLRLFLRAQECRRSAEEPVLLLARRFQPVQALTATSDLFFCLYSSVSRTPPQRIAPPRPCRDIPDTAQPGWKRAVTSRCLHAGGTHGDTPRGATQGPGGLRQDRGDTEGRPRDAGTARGDVTVSPKATRGRVLRLPSPRGDRGLGSWCHPGVTAGVGGHRGGPPGVPSGLGPGGAAESFELEEVLSEEEEDDEDDDDDEEEEEEEEDEEGDEGAALSPRPPVRARRSSNSSSFTEEPLPPLSPHCPHRVT